MKTQLTLLIITLLSLTGTTQSLTEFNHKKLNGHVIEIQSHSFDNIQFDEKGLPILEKAPLHYNFTSIKDGYPLKHTMYQNYGVRGKDMEFNYLYEDGLLKKVSIYSVFEENRDLFKWYQMSYNNGKVSTENVFYDEGELRGTFNYTHEINKAGNSTTAIELYKPKENGVQGNYFFEFNKEGEVITKILSVGLDTGLIYKVISTKGDSIIIAEAQYSSRQYRDERLSSQITFTTRVDDKGNPIYKLVEITGTNPETNEEETFHSLELISYTYAEDEISSVHLSLEELTGQYINEKNNLRLLINDDMTFELTDLKANENEIEEEKPIAENEWIYMLKNKANYIYDTEKGIIYFGDIAKDGILVKTNPYAFIFSPLNPVLKEVYFRKTE